MAENKTQPTGDSVQEFLDAVPSDKRRADALAINDFLTKRTGLQPVLWGSIVGFGTLHYKYETGREGDTMLVGFAPRAASLVLYGLSHELAPELGQHTLGKGCVYVKDLEKIDLDVLGRMVDTAVAAKH